MHHVFSKALRLLHPLMPFLTEELWHGMGYGGRQLRADYEVPPGEKMVFAIKAADAAAAGQLQADAKTISLLIKASELTIAVDYQPGQATPSALNALGTIYMSLGTVDVAAEVTKLQGQLTAASEELARIQARLGNAGFVQKAKVEVINQTTAKRDELIGKCDKLKRLIEAMTGGAG
jgi:valyl-tRNA synthetase